MAQSHQHLLYNMFWTRLEHGTLLLFCFLFFVVISVICCVFFYYFYIDAMSYLWTFFVCLFVLMFALKYTTDLFQSLKTATYLHLLQESLKEL